MPITKTLKADIKVINQTTAMSCDKCSKEAVMPSWPIGDKTAPNGFHLIGVSGCYGSDFPEDGDNLDIVVCDACLKEWVTSFATPPAKSTFIGSTPIKVMIGGTPMWLAGCWLTATERATDEDWAARHETIADDRVSHLYPKRIMALIGADSEDLIEIDSIAAIMSTGQYIVVFRKLGSDASEFHGMTVDDFLSTYEFLGKEAS